MGFVIGVDFDNTIVRYDTVMHQAAVQQGLIDVNVSKNKGEIRNRVRLLPQGEMKWRLLQTEVYGRGIAQADMADGVESFFQTCKARGAGICIVSHKTEFPNYGSTEINLRTAATDWMTDHLFFQADGLSLTREDVYFEATRQAKLARIGELGCTHFVDDLEETFFEPSFPADVQKILYAPSGSRRLPPGVTLFTNWKEITRHLFDPIG